MDQPIPPLGNGPVADAQGPIRVEVQSPRDSMLILTLLASPAFANLLKELEKLLANAGKKLDALGCEVLCDRIMMICLAYDGSRLLADEVSRSNLHEAREPLALLLQILMNEANIPEILHALGYLGPFVPTKEQAERTVARLREVWGDEANDMMAALGHPGPSVYNKEVSNSAVAQLEITLHVLRKLARSAPLAPGRPSKTKDLRFLVNTLADIWEWWTGNRFKYYTDKETGEPANWPTQFVYAVVQFVAPERMRQLKKVTEGVISDRGGDLHSDWYKPSDYKDSP